MSMASLARISGFPLYIPNSQTKHTVEMVEDISTRLF